MHILHNLGEQCECLLKCDHKLVKQKFKSSYSQPQDDSEQPT